MYEMQGPHRGPSHAADLPIARLVNSWPDPPPDLQNSRSARLPGLHASLRVTSQGSRDQVVNDFYCLSPAPRKGFLLSISRFFFGLNKKPAVIPRGRCLSTKYPQGCSQPGGSSLRRLPAIAAYARSEAQTARTTLPEEWPAA